jgi:hypothetical protein
MLAYISSVLRYASTVAKRGLGFNLQTLFGVALYGTLILIYLRAGEWQKLMNEGQSWVGLIEPMIVATIILIIVIVVKAAYELQKETDKKKRDAEESIKSLEKRLEPKLNIEFERRQPFIESDSKDIFYRVLVKNISDNLVAGVIVKLENFRSGGRQYADFTLSTRASKEVEFSLRPHDKEFIEVAGKPFQEKVIHMRGVHNQEIPAATCHMNIVAYGNETPPCSKRARLEVDLNGFLDFKLEDD